jgi:uncharacterized membrane protein YfcA
LLPEIEINMPLILLLVFLGLGIGTLSGFAGVGGGFFMTPALIVLGFPASFAVGTSLAWIVGNAIIGALLHRKLGNVDMKLGLVTIIAAMSGMEVGVRIINWAKNAGLADEMVLSISIVLLLTVGSYTLSESIRTKRRLDAALANRESAVPPLKEAGFSRRLQNVNLPPVLHFPTSGINISLWILLALGFLIGMLAGLIGVGGGFIMVPILIYLVGLPSFMAVGTSLFQIIFSALYGTIRYTISGNVVIFAAFIMLLASSAGIQFGTQATRYVQEVSLRFILGTSILLAAAGSILKLSSLLITSASLQTGAIVVTFTGMGLAIALVIFFFVISVRYNQGHRVPAFMESLLIKKEEEKRHTLSEVNFR